MRDPEQATKQRDGVRRARREDIHALLALTRGPEVGRIRALRRLLKTLTADVYVRTTTAEISGCVAIVYRRSLQHGGLVATIDTLHTKLAGDAGLEEVRALLALVLHRARRRGCVAIDGIATNPILANELQASGFDSMATQWIHDLRNEENRES